MRLSRQTSRRDEEEWDLCAWDLLVSTLTQELEVTNDWC